MQLVRNKSEERKSLRTAKACRCRNEVGNNDRDSATKLICAAMRIDAATETGEKNDLRYVSWSKCIGPVLSSHGSRYYLTLANSRCALQTSNIQHEPFSFHFYSLLLNGPMLQNRGPEKAR